jgi:hypothetical protein
VVADDGYVAPDAFKVCMRELTGVTGGAGTSGYAGITSIGQGALFSMANVACRELSGKSNIRFNEVYLNLRVDYDAVAKQKGGAAVGSSEFGRHYEELLRSGDIDGCRVTIESREDITNLKYQKKLA